MLRHRADQHAFLHRLRKLIFAVLAVCTFVACQSPGNIGPAASPPASATFMPTPILALTPSPTSTSTPSLAQRIDSYIAHLTPTQQIGQLLMLPVYTNSYSSALQHPLQHWDIANAIVYNRYNGGPLMPATLGGWTHLIHALQAHANQALIIATDEERGSVDRLAPITAHPPRCTGLRLPVIHSKPMPRQSWMQSVCVPVVSTPTLRPWPMSSRRSHRPEPDVWHNTCSGHHLCRRVSAGVRAARRRGHLETLAGHWRCPGQSRLWAADHYQEPVPTQRHRLRPVPRPARATPRDDHGDPRDGACL